MREMGMALDSSCTYQHTCTITSSMHPDVVPARRRDCECRVHPLSFGSILSRVSVSRCPRESSHSLHDTTLGLAKTQVPLAPVFTLLSYTDYSAVRTESRYSRADLKYFTTRSRISRVAVRRRMSVPWCLQTRAEVAEPASLH